MRPMTLYEMEQHRRGRRFSLCELPKARPQNKWMQYLPWKTWAEIDPDRVASMREALGCDDGSSAADEAFEEFLAEFAHGRLLLRVIRLCNERLIPPGRDDNEDQARMDRWLPPDWNYDANSRRLSWARPTRFASPPRNFEILPGESQLCKGDASPRHLKATLNDERALARWLKSGEIWIIVARK